MRLTFRERITYIIYTEPYSNAGITIDKFLEIARSIIGVVGAHPHFINDEIVVTLYNGYYIEDFIIEFEYRLNSLLKQLNKKCL